MSCATECWKTASCFLSVGSGARVFFFRRRHLITPPGVPQTCLGLYILLSSTGFSIWGHVVQMRLSEHEPDLLGVSVARGVQDILISPGNGFTSCFQIQLPIWSDSEHMVVARLSVSCAVFACRPCYRVQNLAYGYGTQAPLGWRNLCFTLMACSLVYITTRTTSP